MSRDAHHAGSNVALTATISIVRQRGEATGVSADRWARGGVVDGAPVALERRRVQTLGEEVSRIVLGWHVDHLNYPTAAELAHLEDLALYMARVLAGGGAVA